MAVDTIPEAQLQRWFEQAVAENRLADAVDNMAMLNARLEQLRAAGRVTDRVAREGLENARDLYIHLQEAEALSANENIALAKYSQMRPDLVLHTSSAHYVLVELKTRAAAERQGVQELLAYSAAIKMAMPYVNETLYVIVANAWDTLLQFSVRALILDGKRVLPLQWTCPSASTFSLSVRLDLFEFDFIHPYDPFHALSAAIFACTRPETQSAAVAGYFGWHAGQVVADCRRLEQCGFVLTWRQADWGDPTLKTALVTLNQHWRQNEHVPPGFEEAGAGSKQGIENLIYKQAERLYRPLAAVLTDEDLDPFAVNRCGEVNRDLFPQNGASYEILERRRSRTWERKLTNKDARCTHFETVSFQNLKCLVNALIQNSLSIRVDYFAPFGELEDYARKVNRHQWQDLGDILDLLYLFREHKGYSGRELD